MFAGSTHCFQYSIRKIIGEYRTAFPVLISLFIFSIFSNGQGVNVSQDQIDWQPIEAQLKRALSNGTVEEKRDALFEIRNYRSEPASRIASPALSDADEMVRATAAASVVFLPASEAAQLLIPLLSDRRPFVRREAALALGTVGYAPSAMHLIETLRKDKDRKVRTASAIAIGLTGGLDDAPALVELLREKPTEENEMLRRAAARSLGQIAEFEFTGQRPVNTPHSFLPQHLKLPDQTALGSSHRTAIDVSTGSERLLTGILTSDRESADIKREAAFALGAFRYKAAIPVLEKLLYAGDPYLAEISREALEKIKALE